MDTTRIMDLKIETFKIIITVNSGIAKNLSLKGTVGVGEMNLALKCN